MNESMTVPRPVAKSLPVLTVTQLTQAIQRSLEATFPLVWLQGEISNCTKQSSGHLYFSLKDAHTQIAAVMFRADVARLKLLPSNGDQVKVFAELSLFPARGIYQLIVRELTPMGIGELLLKFEERKKALKERGWFDQARKRPLPHLPARIGVITSPTGAVIQDILHILTRRYGNFHLILYPVKVQGEGAAEEIARAIEHCNQYHIADVLIVGRGGGSIEDLWAFNEECVASAIFQSQIPIISAVGHETDYTIADWVADVRAPTPSAAAEMVLAEKGQILKQLALLRSRSSQALQQHIRRETIRLQGLKKHPYLLSLNPVLIPKTQEVDHLQTAVCDAILQRIQALRWQVDSLKKRLIPYQPMQRILAWKERLTTIQRNLQRAFSSSILSRKADRLRDLTRALAAVDPSAVTKQGYGLCFSEKDHRVITSIKTLNVGEHVRIRLADGELVACVEALHPKNNA